MGQVLSACTVADHDTQLKLSQLEEQNSELKKQLLEAREAYHALKQRKEREVRKKIHKLADDNTKKTQEIAVEKREHEKLQKMYSSSVRRASVIKDKASTLESENERLRKELAVRSSAAGSLSQGDENYSSDNNSSSGGQLHLCTPRDDMTQLRNWLVFKNLNEKDLKLELIKLLSSRNTSHRSAIPEGYKQRYGSDLMDDIGKIMKKGNTYELVEGLFMSKAAYDAFSLHNMMSVRNSKAAVLDIAVIVCCRSNMQLQSICEEYRNTYKQELKARVCKLASGSTFQQLLSVMFSFESREQQHMKVQSTNPMKVHAKISGCVDFLSNKGVKWSQKENKLKLALMIMTNDEEFVRELAKLYYTRCLNTLTAFIDSKVGGKSTTGHWLKIRLEYCADPADFYARRIQLLGDKGWSSKPEAQKINRIIVSTFGRQLAEAQKKFNELNYGDGWHLMEWVGKKAPGNRYCIFLTRLLQNAPKRS